MISSRYLGGKGASFLQKVARHVWDGFQTMATEEKTTGIKIGTHSGVFHCDEALACFMLRQLPAYAEAEIIRTRDPAELSTCDIVVDVGGEYNPKTHRYDHHQRSFQETFSTVRSDLAKDKLIKLSSAGLIYCHFGLESISEILKARKIIPSTDQLRSIYLQVYDTFVEELDAIDNGIPMTPEGKPMYRINTHLSARVHKLNPEWNSPPVASLDQLFENAIELVGKEFTECILGVTNIWLPAREVVKEAIENRHEVDKSGKIMFLSKCCPWKDHLFKLETLMGIEGQIQFCVFSDNSGSYRVQAIPVQPDSFVCRSFLHKRWRGVRDTELDALTGIPGCIFCHANGFIGGNKTKEGAIQMALDTLKSSRDDQD